VPAGDAVNTPRAAVVPPGSPPSGPSFSLLKDLVRQSAVYGAMDLFGRAGVLILVPLYTRALGAEAYGNLEIFVVTQGFLLVFGMLGFNSALTKYYVLAASPEDARRVFGTAVTTILLWGLVFLGIGWLAAPLLAVHVQHDPGTTGAWRLVSATVLFESLGSMVLSLFRSQERPFKFASLSLTRLFTTLVVSVILVGKLGLGVRGALIGTLSGSIVGTLLGLVLVRSYLKPRLEAKWVRSLIQLGFPLALGGLAMFFMNSMDRYFINELSEPGELGVYALANRIAVIMTLVVNAFMMAWPPILFRIVKQPGAGETLSRVVTYYLGVAFFVLLGLTALGREIVAMLAPEGFGGAASLLGFLLGANLLYGVYHVFTAGPVLKDRTRYIPMVVALGVVIGVGVNLLLVPRLGAQGAALARMVAFLGLTVLMMLVGQRMYRIPLAVRPVAGLLVLVAVLLLVAHACEPLPLVARVAAKVGVVLLYVPGVFVAGVVDRDERERLIAMIRRIRRRRTRRG
jgi:O-antigen/teichoic acid export membrane protein